MTSEAPTAYQECAPPPQLKAWQPAQQPIYDITKSYRENWEKGPFFDEPFPERLWPDKSQWIDFLGYQIASPIGVASGPILNSRWVDTAAKLGFDIIAYKTIRNRLWESHPIPNVTFLNTPPQLDPHNLPLTVSTRDSAPQDLDELAITNSFGNPSMARTFLEKDLPRANACLAPGQVMIVSIFGTPTPTCSLTDDFVETAAFARDCGAQILEANFSCPNLVTGEGSLFATPDIVYDIASKIVRVANDIPLIIKCGIFPDTSVMRACLLAVARAGVRAICGLNTISMQVVDGIGQPALTADRLTSGVCGAPIRHAALEFVRDARRIIDEELLDLTLMGVGGITKPEYFDLFFEAGADTAQTATGMMWDPYLAARYHYQNITETTKE